MLRRAAAMRIHSEGQGPLPGYRLGAIALSVMLGMAATSALGAESVESRCKAITARVALPQPVAGDGRGCDAYALYYGTAGRAGVKSDPKAALACASTDQSKDREVSPLDGPAILATIYANGSGAPRDLDRAAAYVCRMNVAEAEQDQMLQALAKIRQDNGPSIFRVCD